MPIAEQPTGSPALTISGLHKSFAEVNAVNGLDLQVSRGECFGLLGPNGAGKTTTIEICEGLTAPDSGSVTLLGYNWHDHSRELRQRIGIQLQETQFPEKVTVEETINLFRSFFRKNLSVDQSISLAQLQEKRNARVGTLSGGQKQRLAMACALVGDPDLVFLDEPTTGLDPQARRNLWDLVEELKIAGRTIILTTHYMEEAERLCDRVAIMDHGRIIAIGSPRNSSRPWVESRSLSSLCMKARHLIHPSLRRSRHSVASRPSRTASAFSQRTAHRHASHFFCD